MMIMRRRKEEREEEEEMNTGKRKKRKEERERDHAYIFTNFRLKISFILASGEPLQAACTSFSRVLIIF